MSYDLQALLSFSIAVPALLGCTRLKKMDTAFFPLVIVLMAGLLNEIISYFLIRNGNSNTAVYNTYSIFEIICFTWQFMNWEKSRKGKRLLLLMAMLLIAVWSTINLFNTPFSEQLNSYFNILYALVIVLISIHNTNKAFVTSKTPFIKSPVFLICMGLIIFFTYSIIVEAFWLYGLTARGNFAADVYQVLAVINVLSNLIFAFAIICIPSKPTFILPSLSQASS